MSASDTLPVSMTMGLLKPFLRKQLARLPAVHVRQADVEHDEIQVLALGDLDALGRGACRENLEFVVQRQLVFQRLAKVLVVVDDENLPCGAHAAQLRLMDCCRGPTV